MNKMQENLLKKASEMGLATRRLKPEGCGDDILISGNGKEVIFNSGFPLALLNAQTDYIAANKQLTKELFEKLEISHPRSRVFGDLHTDADLWEKFWQSDRPYVLKPLDGTDGDGVSMHLRSKEAIITTWNAWRDKYTQFLLEEQVEGEDLRIHAIGGELVAAAVREPAYVMGNGTSTLLELIDRRRAEIETQNPRNHLPIDAAAEALMAEQNVTLNSVIENHRKIRLKYVSNMSLGGIATDITDAIHPDYAAWVRRLAAATGSSIFAIDVMTVDPKLKPGPSTAWALEINVRPHWLHHTFCEGKQHDIAGMMLEEVFKIQGT